ncbi:arp2/3 complex 16 kDa subunit [Cryptococcus deuterogattii 99/473]|uniref:Actin-related protein 2/3 complex subunit 5 n=2 Tax=Cryptococcus deuterogattii TaxID=1859096 RepID=A0A0D0TXK9_9TREE|nr:arp2/3 complex 16 kDa subunit [Cryptococcus deuterogattii LA55]KIR33878.1 arp2/3 complex 16 kDa subunit [Cryptococcus deuterogattii MMRL2647]KIR40573.1 arp2/3 complex 16 kDa subunit [Cryptococcus deuterogattii Ram5]KIR74254.1 arp2/3 complex 16 kDa subunit [Cryptococcus deuterogattii CA1014]KIR94260.1 arp2/3 complex 16 kDa subunit [Cryptococcus deuterogattii CBS 10090]KIS01267.1 arp2/3 complex 16 kDa subunit [Cryptococcus deuterogattii 2001/935-1]KIY55224.1 arp2/3 complex 16 kDa subunit [Cr
MSDYAFRKIDIDALDEDVLLPSDLYDPDPRGPDGVLEDAKRRSSEVRGLVSRGDVTGALNTILTDPPYGDGVDEAKNLTTSSLLLILNSTRSADIPNLIKNLDQVQQDRLMAYLYKGMAALGQGGEVSGSVLLTWHEKLTEAAGVGCIVRVMTDRKTL